MTKWLFHPLILFALTVLAVWLYISLLQTEEKMRLSAESVTVLDQEVEHIANQVSDLEKQLSEANSPESQEQRIRDELLLKKPGEYVVQLPTEQPTPQSIEKHSKKTPLQTWLMLLR